MGYNKGNCYEIDTYKGNELHVVFQLAYGDLGAVSFTSNGPDGGIDVHIETLKGLLCIQCKSGKEKTNVSSIREFNTSCKLAKGKGWYISMGNYTRDAVELADKLHIKLLDYSDMCAAARAKNFNFVYFETGGFVPLMSRSEKNRVYTISFIFTGLTNVAASNKVAIDASSFHRISSKEKLRVVVNGGRHKVILSDRTKKTEEFIIDVKGDTDYRVSVGAIKGFKLEEVL